MSFVHPDRARNLGGERAQDGRGFSVRGGAGGFSPAQGSNRKRRWEKSCDEQYRTVGGEVTSPNGYAKTAGNGPDNSRPGQEQGSVKKAKFDRPRPSHQSKFDAERSKRLEAEAPGPSKRNDPQRPTNKESRRRNLDVEKLERAQNLAPKYPPLRDLEAWRNLGGMTERKPNAEHAFVYRHLRFDQRPKALALKEWKIRVHREMEGLGLEDAYRGLHIKRVSESEVGSKTLAGVKEDSLVTTKKEDEKKKARVEVERMVVDDGFDIDIYGDEETRRKYEPWIRSRMDRT